MTFVTLDRGPAGPGRSRAGLRLSLWLASPALVLFAAGNLANAGNLVANMVFSRWMGPELFGALATLMTLKLAILAVLGSVQMAVSQTVAAAGPGAPVPAAVGRLGRVLLIGLGGLMLLALPAAGQIVAGLGLTPLAAGALAVLVLVLPATAPLCVDRGVALGRLQAGRMAASLLVEMAVRFLGGALAWAAGWGLVGVTAALALSLLAGWAPVARRPVAGPAAPAGQTAALLRAAAPFAALQAALVLLLDGDVLVASALLGPESAGQVAVLGLVQRVQFYSCAALAGLLLPAAARAAQAQAGGRRVALAPVAGLFLAVTAGMLAAAALVPGQVVTLLAGPAFGQAAPLMLPGVLAAAGFTAAYLAATHRAGQADRGGIRLVVAAVAVQALAFGATAVWADLSGGTLALSDLVWAKAVVQAGLAALVLWPLGRGLIRGSRR